MKLAKTIATWFLQILLALLFVMLGVGKFRDANWARNFARWGYPSGSHLVVGGVEAAASALLLVPSAATYGAATLGVVMAGAAATHVVHHESSRIPVPLVYLALLVLVGWIRRRSVWWPRAARNPATKAEAVV